MGWCWNLRRVYAINGQHCGVYKCWLTSFSCPHIVHQYVLWISLPRSKSAEMYSHKLRSTAFWSPVDVPIMSIGEYRHCSGHKCIDQCMHYSWLKQLKFWRSQWPYADQQTTNWEQRIPQSRWCFYNLAWSPLWRSWRHTNCLYTFGQSFCYTLCWSTWLILRPQPLRIESDPWFPQRETEWKSTSFPRQFIYRSRDQRFWWHDAIPRKLSRDRRWRV